MSDHHMCVHCGESVDDTCYFHNKNDGIIQPTVKPFKHMEWAEYCHFDCYFERVVENYMRNK